MQIAIISDIHGNPLALDAVLKKIEELGADKIFCLGDIAMAGFDPNYTIEKIAELEKSGKATVIQGNTDKLIAYYSDDIFELVKKAIPSMAYALQDDVKIIKPENIEFLKNLPEKLELRIQKNLDFPKNQVFQIRPEVCENPARCGQPVAGFETVPEESGLKICLCHGSPRRQDENIYPQTPINEVTEMVSSTDADIIFCGHTHLPCGFQIENAKGKGQTVVNVGSVGRPMQEDKTPVFVMLQIYENKAFEITHHFAPYNNQLAYDKVMERGFSNCRDLANMLIKS